MNSSVSFFYFLSFLTILSAVMVVVSRNPIHSVLYLILTFFTLSGHYILLNAQFLAAVNIIVYAGKGGLFLGFPLLPSSDSSNAVSSPHM